MFDVPPDAAEWRRSSSSPSSMVRDRLAVEARRGDTVIDCEWEQSALIRIFLVVLVSRHFVRPLERAYALPTWYVVLSALGKRPLMILPALT